MKISVNSALFGLVAATALALSLASPSKADEIDDLIKKGKITIAVQTDLPPYGRLSAKNEPEGFDVDVAEKLAKDLGVKLDLVVITAPAFIPTLLTKKADLVIATKGPSPQRSAAVAFSIPYVGFNNTMVGKKGTPASKLEDIAKYRVGVARGALTDDILSAIAPKGTNIMRFEDDAAVQQALISGQVDLTTTGEAAAADRRFCCATHQGNFARLHPRHCGADPRRPDAEQRHVQAISRLWSRRCSVFRDLLSAFVPEPVPRKET